MTADEYVVCMTTCFKLHAGDFFNCLLEGTAVCCGRCVLRAAKFAAGSCPSVFTHMVRLYREPAVQANAREEYWQSLEMRADLHRRGRIASRASVTGDGLPKAPVQPRVVIQARPYSARAPLVVLSSRVRGDTIGFNRIAL